MKGILRRTASRLLSLVVAHAPAKFGEWSRAMLIELDYVEDDWPAFFWALGSTAAVLKISMIQLLLTPKWREKRMVKYIGQILLGAIVAITVCMVGFLVWLTVLKIAGLQLNHVPLWPRLVFILLLEVIYIAVATKLWRRRKLVSVGISLAGLTQLLSVILTVMRIGQ